MLKPKLLLFLIFISSYLCAQEVELSDSMSKPPNIVLILVDDAALMDFGVYGGEAATPNIDELAQKGTIFTHYRASPMCAPSRAMLLTGYDSHLTGVPNLPIFLPPEYSSKPGYKGILNNKVQTIATRLKTKGYRTYMTGKWHLGATENTLPSKRGFDRTFIFNESGADNWEQKPYLPTQPSKPIWYENGSPVELPDDFYSSKTYVDKMMSFMEEAPHQDKPFFAYIAFQAIHIPVQAPKEFVEKYKGRYDKGWEEMKQRRFEKAKELELIPAHAKLGEILPKFDKWEDISAEEKKAFSNDMAVNAAMLEAMDFHIGRYITYLKQKDLLENTVFIVTSDNGPEASDPSLLLGSDQWLWWNENHRDENRLGEKGYFGFIGPQFASAAAGPSAFFKFYTGEGGMRVPLIFSGKNIPTGKTKAFSFITDITPTILDLVGIKAAKSTAAMPMTGHSLFPVLQNETDRVYAHDEVLGVEAAGRAALYKGDYKLTKNGKPYGDTTWRLFDLKSDPGETHDLAASKPALFKEMMLDYENYKSKFGVLEMPDDYETVQEITNKVIRKLVPWLIGFCLGLVGLFVLWRRRKNTI